MIRFGAARLYSPTRQRDWGSLRLLGIYSAILVAFQLWPLHLTITLSQLAQKYRSGFISLMPFADLSLRDPFSAGLAVLLYVPVGFLLTIHFGTSRAQVVRVLVVGAAYASIIEFARLFALSRYTSVSDILLGTVGIVLGALTARLVSNRSQIRDAKIREPKRREAFEAEAQSSKTDSKGLHDMFLALHAGRLRPQKLGYALEKILTELANSESLEVTEPFRVHGEQIDGIVKYDGVHYIVEARWQDKSANTEPVFQFLSRIGGKVHGHGLFISVYGFSDFVVRAIVEGKAINTIFVDGEDLILVLEEYLSFSDMIEKKVKAAQTEGLVYVHPISGAEKHGAG